MQNFIPSKKNHLNTPHTREQETQPRQRQECFHGPYPSAMPPLWTTNMAHGEASLEVPTPMQVDSTHESHTMSSGEQQLMRCEYPRLQPWTTSTTKQPWQDAFGAEILTHCFGNYHVSSPNVKDVADPDVTDFVTSLNPPPFLTQSQKALCWQLLRNMETWWTLSFPTMQSIQEESRLLIDPHILPLPPNPLPLLIQRKIKIIVRAVNGLLQLPSVPETKSQQTEDASDNNASDGLQYWSSLAKEYHNPRLVLREWMFQNFIRPYPSDEEKTMLSIATGMSRSQISNWFINARVRIWQPLITDLGRELQEARSPALQLGAGNSGRMGEIGMHQDITVGQIPLPPELPSSRTRSAMKPGSLEDSVMSGKRIRDDSIVPDSADGGIQRSECKSQKTSTDAPSSVPLPDMKSFLF